MDLGVLELVAMSPADAVFSHCRFVWLSQTNVPVVLLDPGINRTDWSLLNRITFERAAQVAAADSQTVQ
jgi:hypothetical protein